MCGSQAKQIKESEIEKILKCIIKLFCSIFKADSIQLTLNFILITSIVQVQICFGECCTCTFEIDIKLWIIKPLYMADVHLTK